MLATKILGKAMDMTKPSAEKFEIGVITRDASGSVVQKRLAGGELENLLTEARVFEDIANSKK